jgi:mannosyltransferase OCH1-like enzyme
LNLNDNLKLMNATLSDATSSNLLPHLDEGTFIPRVIHQIFFAGVSEKLPPELKENVETIKRLNPGWSHFLYGHEEIQAFIRKNYGPIILSYFERINPKYGAARADLFRYLLMYKCGGVYLDIKSTCNCSLDQVLKPNDKYILSQWRNKPGEIHATFGTSKEVAHIVGGEYQQWHIVTVPGHPFLKAVLETVLKNIDKYRPWLHGTGVIGVLRLTGPLAYTQAIHPLLVEGRAEYRMVKDETLLCFQYSIFKTPHHRFYKTNYFVLTESVVHMKKLHKLPAYLYSLAKKSKRMLLSK